MKLTIRKKLILSFSLVVLLSIIFSAFSIFSIKKVNDNANKLATVCLTGVDFAHTMNTSLANYRIKEYRHVNTSDAQELLQAESDMKLIKNAFENAYKSYYETIVLDEENVVIQKLRNAYDGYMKESEKILNLSREGKKDEAIKLMLGESFTYYTEVVDTSEQLVKLNMKNAEISNKNAANVYNSSKLLLVVLLGLITILIYGIAIYISGNISKRVSLLKNLLDKTGKLNIIYDSEIAEKLNKFKSKDEISDMFAITINMRNELRNIVSKIKKDSVSVTQNSENLSSTIGETSESLESVAKATDELAQGATDLARNVEEGASKLEMLSQEICKVVNSSKQMKELIDSTSKANKDGIKYINILENSVKDNVKLSVEVGNQVEFLESKSDSIGKVTDVIKSITDQINLLSLNAAIEAARAGEQGRGFAVVSDEIRKLANETANSTKEIARIIKEVRDGINITKSKMGEAKIVVDKTTDATNDAKKAFDLIANLISVVVEKIESLTEIIASMDNHKSKVVNAIEGISTVSEEEASTTEEISASIQEQSASVEQISQATNDLKKIAVELNDLINKFKT